MAEERGVNASARLLLTMRGVIEAPVDAVTSALLNQVRGSHVGVSVVSDKQTRKIVVEGGWWYRGETSIEPHVQGSLVTYQILDVADRWRWAAAIISRKPIGQAPYVFADQLQAVGQELGCRAYRTG